MRINLDIPANRVRTWKTYARLRANEDAGTLDDASEDALNELHEELADEIMPLVAQQVVADTRKERS